MVDDRVVCTSTIRQRRRGSWPEVSERQRKRARTGRNGREYGRLDTPRRALSVCYGRCRCCCWWCCLRVERSHRARQPASRATTRRYDITFLVGPSTLDANGLSRSEDVIVGSAGLFCAATNRLLRANARCVFIPAVSLGPVNGTVDPGLGIRAQQSIKTPQ